MKKRKRLIYAIAILISTAFISLQPIGQLHNITQVNYAQAKTKSTTVYTTPKGTKYHKKSCKTIKKSKNLTKTTVKEAKADDYTACKVCKP